MKDRSLKYSGEYMESIIEELRREFARRRDDLRQHHTEAIDKWKGDRRLIDALEAAYREEWEDLKTAFSEKLNSAETEINALCNINSQQFRKLATTLQAKVSELFSYINQSVIPITILISVTRRLF